MSIIRFKYQFFLLPTILVILSLGALAHWGLRPGIDLAGGSLLHIAYTEGDRAEVARVEEVVAQSGIENLGEVRIQPGGDKGYLLRQRDLTPEEKAKLLEALRTTGTIEEVEYNSVGPAIGAELIEKAWWAVGLVTLSIILFIAFAFRHVSRPVASWKYGVVAIITLIHDIILPLGLFSYLGYARGAEVDALFIVALLTILGISINDTIVVFDRIRENLRLNEDRREKEKEAFGPIVDRSIVQTVARSLNTSLTVIIMLVALYVLGPEATKNFALTLIVGMVAGTYSSIFLAAPLLVVIADWQERTPAKS